MLPLLYETTNQVLSPNSMKYLGRLTKCDKYTVSEQINSNYQLSAVFSPTDELIDEIQNQRFLCAKANPFDPPQYFEIYNTGFDDLGRLKVAARHIKHCSYNNLILTDIYDAPALKTPIAHWNYLNTEDRLVMENNFSFQSSITATRKIESGYIKSVTVGAFLEELATVFGGEYHYDNFDITLMANRGERKNYILRWNKNIETPNLMLDTANIYSHFVACGNVTLFYNSGSQETKTEIQICTQPIALSGSTSKIRRIYLWDATSQMTVKEIHAPTENYNRAMADLNTLAATFNQAQLQKRENANLTLKYRPALDEMTAVGLGDTVQAELKGGRIVEAKITKTVYDGLAERWESIELGEEKLKLAHYIAKKR